jgi:hypothetical protein
MRRKRAATASPAKKAVRMAHGALLDSGRATKPKMPLRSSPATSPALASVRNRQNAVPA